MRERRLNLTTTSPWIPRTHRMPTVVYFIGVSCGTPSVGSVGTPRLGLAHAVAGSIHSVR